MRERERVKGESSKDRRKIIKIVIYVKVRSISIDAIIATFVIIALVLSLLTFVNA